MSDEKSVGREVQRGWPSSRGRKSGQNELGFPPSSRFPFSTPETSMPPDRTTRPGRYHLFSPYHIIRNSATSIFSAATNLIARFKGSELSNSDILVLQRQLSVSLSSPPSPSQGATTTATTKKMATEEMVEVGGSDVTSPTLTPKAHTAEETAQTTMVITSASANGKRDDAPPVIDFAT